MGKWDKRTIMDLCVDISSDLELCEIIDNLKMKKFEIDNVEYLLQTLHILPPTRSVCKRSGKMRTRKMLNNNSTYHYNQVKIY